MSDTHGGHKLGLMSPDVELEDVDEEGTPVPYTPKPTATQEYLWRIYQEDRESVAELAGEDEIVVLHCGDATHGDKYPEQLVSTRKADQVLIGAANLAPWAELTGVRTMRLVVGTGAHNFSEASAEVLIRNLMQARYPGLDFGVIWHGLAEVEGVSIDYAHHGPGTGIRVWTSGNQVRYYGRSLMLQEIVAGRKPPDVIVRGHYHEPIVERVPVGEYECTVIVLPAYCGLSDHGHQATRSAHEIHNGIVVLRVCGSKVLDVTRFCRSVDLRTKEVL